MDRFEMSIHESPSLPLDQLNFRPFQQTIEQWRKVFLLSAIVYVVGNTIFVVFGKSEIQSWNTYWEKKEGVEEGVRADGGKDEQRRASGDDQLKRRGSVRSMSSASDTGSKSISEQE